jgi:hypothetical protein
MAERVVQASGLSLPNFLAWPLLAAGLAAVGYLGYQVGTQQHGPVQITSAGPKIEDVRAIAKLAVLRVQVANVLEGQNAGATGIVMVRGDADMAVDLDRIEIAVRDDAQRTATLRIPTPRPDRPRVDHDRTKLYELRKTGLAALNPFADPRADILADTMRAAQAEVERAVQDQEFVTQAKAQAEVLLGAFYQKLGWSISVDWI